MYSLIRRILFRLDAERAHNVTMSLLSQFPALAAWTSTPAPASDMLEQTLWGLKFRHPLGLAAGLDKNGVAVNALLASGFAFVEVGTVTPKPQPGNDKPRLFRLLEDQALINRMGFNNNGAVAMRRHLMRKRRQGVVGVNFGKNKVTDNELAGEDYVTLLNALYPVSDYIVINVSSPNTPGLRDLQTESALVPLVESVLNRRNALFTAHQDRVAPHRPPVLVKLSPDLADDALVSLANHLLACGIDGFIATNTTLARPSLQSRHKTEQGGLSGKPLKTRSTEVIRLLYQTIGGQVPIIGSGGVFTAEDAYEKICAGASLVQVYSSFIYQGPQVIYDVTVGLEALLRRDGFSNITEAVGSRS